MNVVKTERRTEGPGCLIQLLWALFIGLWLGQIWAAVGWVLVVSIVGMPLGIAMLNKLPQIVSLRKREEYIVTYEEGQRTERKAPQVNIVLRALYFVFVGWWLSALWIEATFALMASFIGMPLGIWMLDRIPRIVSLKR
ncbi:MAG: YccF domain-containing protein [Anaerolineae bacterium]